jgi:hypothetical protein
MQFISGDGMNPTEVETPIHQIEGCPMRVLVGFIRVNQCLNLRRQETADGCGPLSRKHLGFLNDQRAEAHGKILFSGRRHTPRSPLENSATRILRALL